MALKTDIRGMHYEYPDYFEVGREKIREFAAAINCEDPASLDEKAAAELGYAGLVAPATFMTLFAILAQKDFFSAVSKNTCIHDDGHVVIEAYTTLMGQQGENSAKIDFL
jgi:hypothetical protein